MGFHERVLDYSVSVLRNDVVDYRRVLRLTTVSGQKVFIAFPDVPPADWLQFVGADVNVFLPAADFDATYRVLREESPVFVTALVVVGLRAFSLDSGDEAPGQAAGDPQALRDLVARTATPGGDSAG
ncbi:MAG: hypothetical protein ACXV1K_12155 [Kineosporiaceae bacterium]